MLLDGVNHIATITHDVERLGAAAVGVALGAALWG